MKLLLIPYYAALLMLAANCKPKTKDVHAKHIARHILTDTIAETKVLPKFPPSGKAGFYPGYYIEKDTVRIALDAKPVSMFFDSARDTKYEADTKSARPSNFNMHIFVDTTAEVAWWDAYSFSGDNPGQLPASKEYYQSFPVFITSHSDSLLLVGSHNFIRVIREAKDRHGRWVEIETHVKGILCGTAARSLLLEPHHILVAKAVRYTGTFRTACRLRLGSEPYAVYSNISMTTSMKVSFCLSAMPQC